MRGVLISKAIDAFTICFYLGTALSAGIYLVVTEHYGWAWIPFVLCFSLNEDNK